MWIAWPARTGSPPRCCSPAAAGSRLGYRLAGYDVTYACEYHPAAAAVYALNSAIAPDERDVREVCGGDIGAVDVLDGSPPCQDFSTTGKRNLEGDRALLYYEFVRLVGEIGPKTFCAENVPGFVMGASRGRHFLPIVRDLRALGYRVGARTLDASWLGVAQARRRLVLIGLRDDLGIDPASAFPRRAARQTVIGDALPDVLRIIKPAAECRARNHKWTQERTWHATEPAPTISKYGVSAYGSKGMLVETRNGEHRPPSVAELKLLCGFPRDFDLSVDDVEPWHVLGNAVPPPMALAWAAGVAHVLTDRVLAASGPSA
jgi:DNA (cytosine-5)-methyltransferase 1